MNCPALRDVEGVGRGCKRSHSKETQMRECRFLWALLFLTCANLIEIMLTLKAPITTAADDKFCDIFTNFLQKIRYDVT